MAIIARWRMPPENSCGYCVARVVGCGMPTRSSSSTARFARLLVVDVLVGLDHLGDLVADAVDRVQRRQRILEDHGDAACPARCAGSSCRRRRAPGPAPWPSRVILADCGSRPITAEEGHRLAGAGLADDADQLALVDVEVDAAHRLHQAVIGRERRPGGPRARTPGAAIRPRSFACLGSRASRRPSPMKLMAQHREQQGQAGEDGQPPIALADVGLGAGEQVAPADVPGGCTPKPKNDSVDSVMMAAATVKVAATMIGPTQFGMRWREIDPPVGRAEGAAGFDELLLLQRQHLAPHDAGRRPSMTRSRSRVMSTGSRSRRRRPCSPRAASAAAGG